MVSGQEGTARNACLNLLGMTVAEAADALGISRATADRYWAYAKVFLYCEMEELRKN